MTTEKPIKLIVESISKVEADWVTTLSALLVPILTIVGVYIAYQQFVINRQRLNYETYERRLAVYKCVQFHLSVIGHQGYANDQDTLKFNSEASEAVFLFKNDISTLISDIYQNSISLASCQQKLYPSDGSQSLLEGDKRSKVAEEKLKLLEWHMETLSNLKTTFWPHMKIT
ncbi:putative uncharacterized protein (plasmid) [Aliivibrio wodanis]|uniref:Uncharacterized protein n=1 Tax=Aliivibrio wodanis TaxID=80852 RepID=A0A090I896_9GAMM|nr:putative uncharacterized protein [Aliivibrio wodanis]